jgi:ssRNA-specific RNase YbeY (16S rRNA maturation enzyme)
MIDVVNLQRKISIDTAAIRSFAKTLSINVPDAAGRVFSVAFVNDGRMKQLNELFRGKKTTTDVLSFPHEPDEFDPDKDNLGDIVISAEQAAKQAARERTLTRSGDQTAYPARRAPSLRLRSRDRQRRDERP